MSGIFNLFGGVNVTSRSQQTVGSTKVNVMGSNGGPLKQGSTPKPRGLSIRSKNDLNVCAPAQSTPNALKPKLNTLECSMRPSTPRQKERISKLQVVREKQLKGLSPTSKSPHFNYTIKQKGVDDFLFRKPATPQNNEKKLIPKPESIPDYTDDDFFFNYSLSLESPLKKKTEVVTAWLDEGFESDPELLPTPPTSPIRWRRCESPISDADLEPPEIPILSDSDDDF